MRSENEHEKVDTQLPRPRTDPHFAGVFLVLPTKQVQVDQTSTNTTGSQKETGREQEEG